MKTNKKDWVIGVGMCVLFLLVIIPVTASAVPSVVNYQGYLTDAGGNPLNGDVAITFRMWSAEMAGTELWSESHAGVAVSDGVFNALLGSSVPISVEILTGDRWLGMTVGTDAEMTPRMKVTSVAYAIRAGYAESVAVGSVDTSALSDTAVTEAKIAAGAVTGAKIASGSVTSDKVASGAVSSDKIASEAVTGAKIAAGTLTASHLQNGAAIAEILDNDGVGSGLDADLLDGLHASAFSLAGHNHDGAYVNATGDSMIATSSGYALDVTNTGTGAGGRFYSSGSYAAGVLGLANGDGGQGVHGAGTNTGDVQNYGGYFIASGTTGRGVYGRAENSGNVTNYGGYFEASGQNGRGVYGSAAGASGIGVYGTTSDTPGTNYGGYFASYSGSGQGVHGEATFVGDYSINYGGHFIARGGSGRGVYGFATNSGDVTNYGGYFEASGQNGQGVYGFATNSGDVTNYGGYFEASGQNGRGVYGSATNSGDVTNYGGWFTAYGTTGRGVFGGSYGTSGRGVWGSTSGTSGVGVYGSATNAEGVRNYGGYFTASGTEGRGIYSGSSGSSGIGVRGEASNEGNVTNYGGYFTALGTSGRGVYAQGKAYDFYASTGTGINYGPFTGGHEVKLSADFPEDTKPGMIVSVTGQTQLRHQENGTPSLSSTLPTVKLSIKAADKAVFGVLVAETPLPEDHWYEPKEGERFATVNALGEGRVWVSNINGEIEVGDYITTSSIPGYGQRQDDDVLHSYTLGKAIEAVDWPSVQETVLIGEREIKVYLIAVTYTSG